MCIFFNQELPEELQQIPSSKVPLGDVWHVDLVYPSEWENHWITNWIIWAFDIEFLYVASLALQPLELLLFAFTEAVWTKTDRLWTRPYIAGARTILSNSQHARSAMGYQLVVVLSGAMAGRVFWELQTQVAVDWSVFQSIMICS